MNTILFHIFLFLLGVVAGQLLMTWKQKREENKLRKEEADWYLSREAKKNTPDRKEYTEEEQNAIDEEIENQIDQIREEKKQNQEDADENDGETKEGEPDLDGIEEDRSIGDDGEILGKDVDPL